MDGENGLSRDLKSFGYNGRYSPLSPFAFSTTYPESSNSPIELKGNVKSLESLAKYHQRCSSESFLVEEEQPSWLDDLLNESETLIHRGHRRSASDSFAYLEEAADTLTSKFVNLSVETSTRSQNQLVHCKDVVNNSSTSIGAKANSLAEKKNQESEEVVSSLAVEHSKDESSSQNHEGSANKTNGSQGKPSESKAESKRAKQHNAHRSRVRKLQYIAHLERTVQMLKAEGSEVSAGLEFVEQQNLILTMENRALRQHMESISQERIIKHWEQGMLEREIGRLQALYHLQKQQQMQMHQQQQQPHNQHSKHRRNRSRDVDHHQLKNKDATSSKGFVRA